MKLQRVIGLGAGVAALGAGAYAAYDIMKNLSVKALPDLPETDEGAGLINDLLLYLERPDLRARDGVTLDHDYVIKAITPAKRMIDGRFDCLDFRMGTLLRILYSHGDTLRALSPEGAQMIEDAFLGAKYWMTEPGRDSMCYWSENHQLLLAVAEYLAGQLWPDKIFTNDGSTGRERMARGRVRVKFWMRQRFDHGYSEFNSTNYLLYNVGPAANFIQFAAPEDREMAEQMKMCVDLLLFDVACYMHKFSLMAPTGRAYVYNMSGEPGDRARQLTDYLWGLRGHADDNRHSQLVNFFAMARARDAEGKPYYEFPGVLRAVGLDTSERELRASYGLNTAELPERGYVGHGDAQIMRQWSMEAFTNPELLHNTVTYIKANDMFHNMFLNRFKVVNLHALRHPRALEALSRFGKPMPNGIAIQRANLYCWQAPHCALGSLQRYHPGGFGAQQWLNVANFGGRSVVFTAHPAKHESASSVKGYPGYWAGFGRAPHSVQHKNVLILLYQIPKRPGFLELYSVPQFTHTYLPEAYFDEVRVRGRYAFARLGDAFLSVTAFGALEYLPWSELSAKAFENGLDQHPGSRFDLIQHGSRQYWIYELSDAAREGFEEFMARVMDNTVAFDGEILCLESGGRRYETEFGGDFILDGETVPLEYKRFDNPYCTAERDAKEFVITHNGQGLRLHFDEGTREIL